MSSSLICIIPKNFSVIDTCPSFPPSEKDTPVSLLFQDNLNDFKLILLPFLFQSLIQFKIKLNPYESFFNNKAKIFSK